MKSILDKKRVDGIIAEPTKSGLPNPNLNLYRQIMEQGIPVIFINSYYPELKAPHVSLDDKIAGKMATKYLIQCGHREIAAIFKADDGQGHRRYAGYIEALMEADIRIEDKRIVWIDTEAVRNRNMREESSWILRRIQGCTAVSYTHLSYDERMEYFNSNVKDLTTLVQTGIQDYVYLETSNFVTVQTELNRNNRNSTILAVGVAIVAMSISLLLSGRAARSVTRPIRDLCDLTEKVAGGDFSVKTQVEAGDEIAVLTRSFNDMTEEIGILVDLSLIHI